MDKHNINFIYNKAYMEELAEESLCRRIVILCQKELQQCLKKVVYQKSVNLAVKDCINSAQLTIWLLDAHMFQDVMAYSLYDTKMKRDHSI